MRRVALLSLALAAFVLGVGPWPVYRDSHYRESDYYARSIEGIARGAHGSGVSHEAGRLLAGWASVDMTPPVGTPLAGYRPRDNDMISTGVHDRLAAHAVAFGDGTDTAVIVVGDMLIVPPAVAAGIRERLAAEPGIAPGRILFNATHTHSGPGGLAPGLGPRIVGGPYDPAIEKLVMDRMTEAARLALSRMLPAEFATGAVAVPELLKNRVRDGGVDDELSVLSIRRTDGGGQCLLVSYASHATVLNKRWLEFSRDYPGVLQDHLRAETGADVIFVSGAVGSMGDDPPRPSRDRWQRATLMGRQLGSRLMDPIRNLTYRARADVAAFGLAIRMPPLQVRPLTSWFRVSPWLARALGMPVELWLQFMRLGDVIFVGLPFDFSGETSLDWKAYAARRGLDLWTTSFNGGYGGYLTPDRYYLDEPLDYETGLMSWYGPNAEAYLTDLFELAITEFALETSPRR